MVSQKRVTAQMPSGLLQAVSEVNQEIKEQHGVTISLADAQRIMCVVYVRTVLEALGSRKILSPGEIAEALCAGLSRQKECLDGGYDRRRRSRRRVMTLDSP